MAKVKSLKNMVKNGISTEDILSLVSGVEEKIEYLLIGIKGGLDSEQLEFMESMNEDCDVDWLAMGIVCVGFLLGMSVDEMKTAYETPGPQNIINSRIADLLEKYREENVPAAKQFIQTYETPAVSSEAEGLLNIFRSRYYEKGYKYSGCICLSEIMGSEWKTLNELLDKKIIVRRDCEKECYELSIMERYKLITKLNLFDVWSILGGRQFELNNGYFGEYYRVLREIVKAAKDKPIKVHTETLVLNLCDKKDGHLYGTLLINHVDASAEDVQDIIMKSGFLKEKDPDVLLKGFPADWEVKYLNGKKLYI